MSKLDRLGWVVTNWFEVGGFRFSVRSTSHVFGEWMTYALGSYLVEPTDDEIDDSPIYSLVVEDGESPSGRVGTKYHILYWGSWDIVRTLDVQTLARSFLQEIEALTYSRRDDAVYLAASAIQRDGRTVVIPSSMVQPVAAAGRRLSSSLDLMLPAGLSLALDPDTGHLVPPATSLDVPSDWSEALERCIPAGPHREARASIEQETPVDGLLTRAMSSEPMVEPVSRGRALVDLMGYVRNLQATGGTALIALARMLAGAEAVQIQWHSTPQFVQVLGAALDGGAYVQDRREDTAHDPMSSAVLPRSVVALPPERSD